MEAFLKLIRTKNLVIIALTQLMAFVFLRDVQYFTYNNFFGFGVLLVGTVLIASAGYIINDYLDIKIDLINDPDKVVIGIEIKRRWAMVLHFALNISAVLIGLLVSWKLSLVFALIAILLWVYSEYLKLKLLIGNI